MSAVRKLSPLARHTARVLAATHSLYAIGKALGVSAPTIHRALRDQHVAPGKGYRKVRASVSPVAKLVATAQVLLGK